MSTYISGVTDFIPQFQPFQPDLNFYATALQTKQNQYDTNYKALNNVYGQYFYADLTHGDNLKKKDELIKAIDFNLKRVSGLDLSLDQNVDQATQVFKPFYQDKHLMKDMAWTKNINNEKAYGAGLKNNRDEKQRAQYWDDGLKFLQYKTEEFKEASLEETMNMGNASYTPYVNVIEKAQKIAKDAGFHVESVDSSKDGKWMITTTNGKQILPALSHLLEAQLGSDPAVIDVYKTQAYVNRKDYAYSNAAQFAGDKNAAEMSYLTESYTMLKKENDERKKQLEENSKVYDAKAKAVEQAKEGDAATPDTESYLERLNQARSVNSTVLANTDANVTALATKTGTMTTSTGFTNPYGDIESLRYKVDNAMASRLMQKDLSEAADIFVSLNSKQKVDANPFAVQEIAHNYRMQETALRNKGTMQAALARNQSDKEINIDKTLAATGGYHLDQEKYIMGPDGKPMANPTYGRQVINPEADTIITEPGTKGSSTDVVNYENVINNQTNQHIDKYVVPYMQNMLSSMQELYEQNLLSPEDKKAIFGNNMTIKQFNEAYQENPHNFIKKMGAGKIKQITSAFQKYLGEESNVGNSTVDNITKKMSGYNNDIDDYLTYRADIADWRSKTKKDIIYAVKREIDTDLKKYVNDMFNPDGTIVSEAEFEKKTGNNLTTEDYIQQSVANNMFTVNPLTSSKIAGSKIKTAKLITPYDELRKIIHDTYSSTSVNIKAPVGFGVVGGPAKGGGLTTNVNSIRVSPDAYGTTGAQYWNELKNDLNNLDLGDDQKIKISYTGPTASSANENKTAKVLLDAMIRETSSPGSKFKNFKLSSQALASNDYRKGAMIIYPDKAWLKDYVGKLDDKENSTNTITPQQEQDILQNGISIIAPSESFKNGLFQSSYVTPLEASVKYNKEKGVTIRDIEDKQGFNALTIKTDEFGTGDYRYNYTYSVYNTLTNKYEKFGPFTSSSVQTGANLELMREEVHKTWAEQRVQNNIAFNNRNK
jgi:D-ribose pyranose/furanose isomerase RbsD